MSFNIVCLLSVIESVGPHARTLLNLLACVGWVFGCCILSLFAYMTRNWIYFNMITSFTIVTFFFYWRYTNSIEQLLGMVKGGVSQNPPVIEKIGKPPPRLNLVKLTLI